MESCRAFSFDPSNRMGAGHIGRFDAMIAWHEIETMSRHPLSLRHRTVDNRNLRFRSRGIAEPAEP